MTVRARADAYRRGIAAEESALAFLIGRGFEILGVNVRVGRYEIDVLARDGDALVIVEVRIRSAGAMVKPLDTVNARKQSRLRTAATLLWRRRFANDPRFNRARFDCVALTRHGDGETRIEHVRAAF